MKPKKRKTKVKDFKDKGMHKFAEAEKWKKINKEKKKR
jgi:hypothetical protein